MNQQNVGNSMLPQISNSTLNQLIDWALDFCECLDNKSYNSETNVVSKQANDLFRILANSPLLVLSFCVHPKTKKPLCSSSLDSDQIFLNPQLLPFEKIFSDSLLKKLISFLGYSKDDSAERKKAKNSFYHFQNTDATAFQLSHWFEKVTEFLQSKQLGQIGSILSCNENLFKKVATTESRPSNVEELETNLRMLVDEVQNQWNRSFSDHPSIEQQSVNQANDEVDSSDISPDSSVGEKEQLSRRRSIRILGQMAEKIRLKLDHPQWLLNEKLRVTKDLVYGTSHEINNPLANIASRAQRILSTEKDPNKRELASVINDQAFRGFEMLANMMFFANPPKPQKKENCIRKSVSSAVGKFQQTLKEKCLIKNVQVELNLEPLEENRSLAFCDSEQFQVAIECLLKNAAESYRPEEVEKRIFVSVSEVSLPPRFSKSRFNHSKWLAATISDTGNGIGEYKTDQLFHPYFSGREAGRGLGFGLAKVYRIAEMNGGHLCFLENEQLPYSLENSKGCTAVIFLPVLNSTSIPLD